MMIKLQALVYDKCRKVMLEVWMMIWVNLYTFMGNVQGGGRKFMGHFMSQIIRTIQTGSYEANKPKICNSVNEKSFPVYRRWQSCTMAESGDVIENVLENEEWLKRWDVHAIGFHNEHIHPALVKHGSAMINGRSSIKIFVPLCGKSWDMKWLADQGHTVIGVEVAQRAIEEFSEEQKVPFTSHPVPAVDGMLFQSEDKKLQIYNCDFYKISKDLVGQFGAIWDRGSLVAINVNDRDKYTAIIKSLMAPDCRYLISVLQYEESKYGGPPHYISDDQVKELYESDCTVKLLDDTDVYEERHSKWGIDWLREKIFILSRK